jgi:hypothetical protein
MGGCDGVEHVSRYSGLFRVETSRAKVSQSDLKTGRGVMAGGVRRLCQSQLKTDGSMRWTVSDPVTLDLSFSFY